MAVSEDDVRNLARLAHLELAEREIAEMRGHLDILLGYIARIQAVDVEGAPETTHHGDREMPLRPGVARPGLPRATATAGAPAVSSGLFEVPRVIASRGPSAPSPGDEAEADEVAP